MESIYRAPYQQDIAEWLLPPLEGRDLLFVTLTSVRVADKAALSRGISRLIHALKRRVLGRRNEHLDLACVVVLEPHFFTGYHAHLILENPLSLGVHKAFEFTGSLSDLAKTEWSKLGIGACHCQDVRPVHDL